jgi:hypothetical protein
MKMYAAIAHKKENGNSKTFYLAKNPECETSLSYEETNGLLNKYEWNKKHGVQCYSKLRKKLLKELLNGHLM